MAGIIIYEGVNYRKIDRKAEVGDLITYSYKGRYDDIPRKVIGVTHGAAQFEPFYGEDDHEETMGYAHYAYHVLEGVTKPQSDVTGLIANLGRRLHEVEASLAPREFAEVKPDDTKDAVNSPAHYKRGKFETIEVIAEITQGYSDGFVAHCAGTAIKYIARAPFKHATPTEDLRKAAKYLEFAIKRLEAEVSA